MSNFLNSPESPIVSKSKKSSNPIEKNISRHFWHKRFYKVDTRELNKCNSA